MEGHQNDGNRIFEFEFLIFPFARKPRDLWIYNLSQACRTFIATPSSSEEEQVNFETVEKGVGVIYELGELPDSCNELRSPQNVNKEIYGGASKVLLRIGQDNVALESF